MLPRGEWHPQIAGADPKVHGYHISSLYSPVGWLSWAQVAAKREAAGKDRRRFQVFTNTILGLPWAEEGEVPDADRLYERRESYRIGRVPVGGLLLTCGVDVQIRRLECEIVAWGRDKHSWSVDYRVFEGKPTSRQSGARWRGYSMRTSRRITAGPRCGSAGWPSIPASTRWRCTISSECSSGRG